MTAEVLNLFDEEPEPYGPKPRDRSGEPGLTGKKNIESGIRGLSNSPQNPLGAPPLDWWVIDD